MKASNIYGKKRSREQFFFCFWTYPRSNSHTAVQTARKRKKLKLTPVRRRRRNVMKWIKTGSRPVHLWQIRLSKQIWGAVTPGQTNETSTKNSRNYRTFAPLVAIVSYPGAAYRELQKLCANFIRFFCCNRKTLTVLFLPQMYRRFSFRNYRNCILHRIGKYFFRTAAAVGENLGKVKK